MIHPRPASLALALVIAANVGPWAAARCLGPRGAAPLDFGGLFFDRRRLLGDHKTWRGVAAAVLVCTAVGAALGYSPAVGALFGLLAMLADAASSFVKRRFGRAAGAEVPGLDQLPEALVPLAALAKPLGIGASDVLLLSAVFLALDVATMPFRHRRGSR